jgi:hypothetical protein
VKGEYSAIRHRRSRWGDEIAHQINVSGLALYLRLATSWRAFVSCFNRRASVGVMHLGAAQAWPLAAATASAVTNSIDPNSRVKARRVIVELSQT